MEVRWFLPAGAFAWLFAMPLAANACSCLGASDFSAMVTNGNAVFEGTVLSRKQAGGNHLYRFKTCNGKTTILVETPASEELCGVRLRVGAKTVLAAARWNGRYRTTLCHRADIERHRSSMKKMIAASKKKTCSP